MAEAVSGPLDQDGLAVLVEAVEDVALGADREAVKRASLTAGLVGVVLVLDLEDRAGRDLRVIRVERREPIAESLLGDTSELVAPARSEHRA